jgi:acyl-coenzyme A synthetase/AMP-(fatty) acid ligase
MAYVVPIPGVDLVEDEIIATTRNILGPIKKVTSVEFVSSLPKSGVGKILRRNLRSRHWTDSKVCVGGA